MKFFLACAFVILLFFNGSSIIAQEAGNMPEPTGGQINEALLKIVPIRFLPTHPLYLLITLKETISRFFKPSAVKRAGYDFVLTSKRIKESYYLYKNGDLKNLGGALGNYSKRVNITIEQIEKARSQNQEISMLADNILDGLEPQEVLLRYLILGEGKVGGIENLDNAVSAFRRLVDVIDNVRPGIKGRFNLFKVQNDKTGESTNSASLVPIDTPETTKSSKPRRIIY